MAYRSVSRGKLKLLGFSISLGLATIGCVSGYWSFSMSGSTHALQWWIGWFQDVGTEMLGAAVTILLVELVIYQKRDEASRLDTERMRRRDHFVAQLKRSPTLEQRQKILDRMKRQNLLRGAWLYEADLQGMNLSHFDLEEADLFESNLQMALLQNANLKDATLRQANLSQANLNEADLTGVDLSEANLEGANLSGATLKDATLNQIKMNEKTCLPDDSYWSPNVDLTQFL